MNQEFNPGISPKNINEKISGLKEAVVNTQKIIEEYRSNNWDAKELEKHLKMLEQQLEQINQELKNMQIAA